MYTCSSKQDTGGTGSLRIHETDFCFLMQYGGGQSKNNFVLNSLCFTVGRQEVLKGERTSQYLAAIISTNNQFKYTICLGNDILIRAPVGSFIWAGASHNYRASSLVSAAWSGGE